MLVYNIDTFVSLMYLILNKKLSWSIRWWGIKNLDLRVESPLMVNLNDLHQMVSLKVIIELESQLTLMLIWFVSSFAVHWILFFRLQKKGRLSISSFRTKIPLASNLLLMYFSGWYGHTLKTKLVSNWSLQKQIIVLKSKCHKKRSNREIQEH